MAGYKLRSGAAEGMDFWFEQGCDEVGGDKEIFLPWRRFQNHTSPLYHEPPEAAFQMAYDLHWDNSKLNQNSIKMHARNACQVLGERLDAPCDFVVCWTPDGVTSHQGRSKATGGTGTAISIADVYGIVVYNLNNSISRMALNEFLVSINLEPL